MRTDSDTPDIKPVEWIGSSRDDLVECPLPVRRAVGFALYLAQIGEKSLSAKPLKGFGGAGVLEIVEDFDGNTFRAVYTVKFPRVVFVLHVFQKKSKSGKTTPKSEIDLLKRRLNAATELYQQRYQDDQ